LAKDRRQEEIGKLDRRIIIQRNNPSIDANSGQRIDTWTTFATVWASWTPSVLSDEKFESDEERPIQKGVFKIRYLRINTSYKILWNGQNWDIVSVITEGREKFSLIEVESRDIVT
jgi:SPP1 family predicted phage head-tail adaptor